MHDAGAAGSSPVEEKESITVDKANEAVSTHVLVPEQQVEKLRELSRRTRVAQSEYLREAVDDLLVKYGRLDKETR